MSEQHTWAVIDLDGTSYVVQARDRDHAIDLTRGRECETEVEDYLDIEMPVALQGDASGAGQAWLAEAARQAGMRVAVVTDDDPIQAAWRATLDGEAVAR